MAVAKQKVGVYDRVLECAKEEFLSTSASDNVKSNAEAGKAITVLNSTL